MTILVLGIRTVGDFQKMIKMKQICIVFTVIIVITHGSPADIEQIEQDNPVPLPTENGEENLDDGLFEGDIILPKGRNVVRDPNRRWPDCTVPYEMKAGDYTASDVSIILSAMTQISKRTCIKFVPRTTQKDYVYISSITGCYSNVGRIGGRQTLSLRNPGCIYRGTIMHELLHTLGIWHEHSRHDRDRYIQIIAANIRPGTERNFAKLSLSSTQTFGFPYDFSSIMHYAKNAFSVDGKKATILTKPPGKRIGQRSYLSAVDIGKIRKWYECPT